MFNVDTVEVEELNFDEVVTDHDYFGFDHDIDATSYFKEAEPLMGNGLLEIEDKDFPGIWDVWRFNRSTKVANGEEE